MPAKSGYRVAAAKKMEAELKKLGKEIAVLGKKVHGKENYFAESLDGLRGYGLSHIMEIIKGEDLEEAKYEYEQLKTDVAEFKKILKEAKAAYKKVSGAKKTMKKSAKKNTKTMKRPSTI
jgi:hypothetical protein